MINLRKQPWFVFRVNENSYVTPNHFAQQFDFTVQHGRYMLDDPKHNTFDYIQSEVFVFSKLEDDGSMFCMLVSAEEIDENEDIDLINDYIRGVMITEGPVYDIIDDMTEDELMEYFHVSNRQRRSTC